jgi:hypothetical protein
MRKLVALAFLLAFSNAYPADDSIVKICIKQAKPKSSPQHIAFLKSEGQKVDSLTLKKTVKWSYGGNSGEVLMVETMRRGTPSCVLYLKDGTRYQSIGGNDFCSWKKDPKLNWNDNIAWLEFPTTKAGNNKNPVTENEPTIHFNKTSGGICVLGLPLNGFENLRCPDDEAPASK